MTGEEIASRLHLARSTVAAEFVRLGLNPLSALAPKQPVRRYERARPGDLIQLDIKKLACFGKPDHRVTRTPAPERRRRLGIRPRRHRRRLASPTGRCWLTSPRTAARLPRSGPSADCAPRRHGRARNDRQRLRLPQPAFAGPAGGSRCATSAPGPNAGPRMRLNSPFLRSACYSAIAHRRPRGEEPGVR